MKDLPSISLSDLIHQQIHNILSLNPDQIKGPEALKAALTPKVGAAQAETLTQYWEITMGLRAAPLSIKGIGLHPDGLHGQVDFEGSKPLILYPHPNINEAPFDQWSTLTVNGVRFHHLGTPAQTEALNILQYRWQHEANL